MLLDACADSAASTRPPAQVAATGDSGRGRNDSNGQQSGLPNIDSLSLADSTGAEDARMDVWLLNEAGGVVD
jgi:hypothetical protein